MNETFHVQTDDELIEKELKQLEADDQALQTILLGLPEDIYAAVDKKKAKLFNEWEMFTSTDGESIESYYHHFLKLMNDLKRNKHFLEKIAMLHQDQPSFNQNYMQQPMPNPEDITDPTAAMNMALALMAKNVKNQVIQNAAQNLRVQNVRNQNGLIGVLWNANHNSNGNDLDEIKEVNANCILMANLQEASTSSSQTYRAPVYDSDGSAESKQNSQSSSTSFTDKTLIIPSFLDSNGSFGIQDFCFRQEPLEYIGVHDNDASERGSSVYYFIKYEFLDDTTPSVPRKFLNEVKSTIETLQRVVKQRMTLDTHNWSSSAHQELHKILKDEIFPIVNQVDARVQNFEIQFLKEAAKFVGDFKSLAKEADESLAKHKALELEIERLLRAVVSQDIMSVVQNNYVGETSNLRTELEHTKERFENCIIKKENEYAKLWNDWYKKCKECKFDKISYDNAYNDMQQKIERLQAQLGDLKGKTKVTSCVSVTLNPLSRKLENENVELEFQVSDQKDNTRGTSANTKFAKQSIVGNLPKVDETHALLKPVTSNSTPSPQGSNVVKNDKMIASGMFRINPFKTSREEKHVPNKVRASAKTNPITVSQPPVITKKVLNSDSNGLSSTGVDNTKTRRPQPRSNTKNDRVPSTSKSSQSKNKEVEVEKHHRNLMLSRNKKHMSSKCNNVKLATQNVKVVCAMCKQCLISVNHDVCLLNYVNGLTSRGCSKHMTENLNRLINFVWKFLGTVRFENDHVAVILGFGDLQWGNILITRVYFVEGLGHNLFSVGQFYDSDLKVAFRRNACFVRNIEGVNLLKGNHSTNLYTINLHEMASASPICLMARTSSTKSWLWHQRLSHLNFDTINDLAKNDLVFGLPKFKYHKEHLCPSCEQGKSKRTSHPPKPVSNSRQRLHLLHIDLCGPMRIASINGKRQQPTKGELDLLFEAMYDDYIGGQPSAALRTVLAFQAHQVHQTPTTSTSIADTAPTPTNSSSQATIFPNTSQDVDELNLQQQHAQQQGNQAFLQPETVADNVPNAMFDANSFVNSFATPSTSAAESSSTQYVDPSNMHTFYQPYPHEFQWTKDHPLE
uniref:Retrovirus-related Pol polyprotein from transposon TNT 1-94 n=1 Tax=Tanacetum cinerariifolium TaxID=118510 RepID=A0A6L2KUD6_TANCI|nr:retrovirus-related Pol polyprotein from transposon TNT 1-94 [Tanacetum cinerariifolium]